MTDPVISRSTTEEDNFFLEQAYKDPVHRIERIEDTAKFLAGTTSATSGLYLAAYKIALGKQTAPALVWLLPYLFWSAALLLFVLVLLPRSLKVHTNDAAHIKAALISAGKWKHRRLLIGAVCFLAGILAGAWPFHSAL